MEKRQRHHHQHHRIEHKHHNNTQPQQQQQQQQEQQQEPQSEPLLPIILCIHLLCQVSAFRLYWLCHQSDASSVLECKNDGGNEMEPGCGGFCIDILQICTGCLVTICENFVVFAGISFIAFQPSLLLLCAISCKNVEIHALTNTTEAMNKHRGSESLERSFKVHVDSKWNCPSKGSLIA